MSKKPILNYDTCPCSGKNLEKLIQPAILAILAEGNLHGYKIVQQLAKMPGLKHEKPDCTGVYRLLKSMETRGMVVSTWDLSETGPAKRSFSLTPEGISCLSIWIDTLKKYRQVITKLLTIASKASVKKSCACGGSKDKPVKKKK